MEIENRNRIYEYVIKFPGLHLCELVRKLDIPKSTLNYHLRYLEKHGFIVKRSNKRFVRYYAMQQIDTLEKKYLNLLRQETPYKIILYLFQNPESSLTSISRSLDKHPTTITFHLLKLDEAEALDKDFSGNKFHYRLKNPEYVSDLLFKYGVNSWFV